MRLPTGSYGRPVTSSWLRQVLLLVPNLRATLLTGFAFSCATECCKLVPPYLLKTVIDWLGSGSTPLGEILLGVFEAQPNVVDRERVLPCAQLAGEIELREVGFHYQPGRPVLRQVSLSIPARSVIAMSVARGAARPR